jgi:hypothetical protein
MTNGGVTLLDLNSMAFRAGDKLLRLVDNGIGVLFGLLYDNRAIKRFYGPNRARSV